MRIPRLSLSLRWLLVAVAIVALTMWLWLAIIRSEPFIIGVRVENISTYPLEIVDYAVYTRKASTPPSLTRAGVVKPYPTSFVLSPGTGTGLALIPKPTRPVVVFEFSCKGPNGKIRTCSAEVPNSTGALGFLVGDSTIQVIVDAGP
jgi:hypothetical protein